MDLARGCKILSKFRWIYSESSWNRPLSHWIWHMDVDADADSDDADESVVGGQFGTRRI